MLALTIQYVRLLCRAVTSTARAKAVHDKMGYRQRLPGIIPFENATPPRRCVFFAPSLLDGQRKHLAVLAFVCMAERQVQATTKGIGIKHRHEATLICPRVKKTETPSCVASPSSLFAACVYIGKSLWPQKAIAIVTGHHISSFRR